MSHSDLTTLAALAVRITEFPAQLELLEPIEIRSEWGTTHSRLSAGNYECLSFGDAKKTESYFLLKPLEMADKLPFLHFESQDLPHWRIRRTL